MITIELQNEQEAQILINIIDVALKSKGIELSQASVYFLTKIDEAIEKSKEPKKELTKEKKIIWHK